MFISFTAVFFFHFVESFAESFICTYIIWFEISFHLHLKGLFLEFPITLKNTELHWKLTAHLFFNTIDFNIILLI